MRPAVIASTVAAALLVIASSAASAQPAMTAPIETGPAPATEVKSETSATLLALGATLGGIAMVGAGATHNEGSVVFGGVLLTLIGPSAGHLYAGENGHAVKMTLLRTGGFLVLGMGVIAATTTEACATSVDGTPQGSCGRESRSDGEKMLWIGGATLLGATLYDLWDAHNAARRANERAARWTVAPSLMAGASGTTVPALTIGGAF